MEPTLLLPLVATEGDMAVATVDLEVGANNFLESYYGFILDFRI